MPLKFPEILFTSFLSLAVIVGLNPLLVHLLSQILMGKFTLPFVFNFYNLKRITELTFLISTGILILCCKRLRLDVFEAFYALSLEVQLAISLFFLWGLLSASLALYPLSGFFGLFHDFLWFLSGLLLSRHLTSLRLSKIFYGAFSLSIGLYVFFALLSYFLTYHSFAHGKVDSTFLTYLTVYPQFLNPRFLAQIFILTWPLFIYLCVIYWKRKPAISLLLLFINSYWMTLAIENESRAIFLSVGISLISLLVLAGKHRSLLSLWFRFLGATVFISVVLTQLFFSIGLDLQNPFLALIMRSQEANHYNDRLGLWTYTLDLILKYPAWGVGPLNFAAFPNPEGVAHPHNTILKIAVEWGVPAAILFCFILFKGVFTWIHFFTSGLAKTHPDVGLFLKKSTLTVIFIGGIVDSLVSGNTVMPISQLFLAIFLGWAYGLVLNEKTFLLQSSSQYPRLAGVFLIGVAIASVGLTSIMIDDLFRIYHSSQQGVLDACQNRPSCSLPPLMWFPEQVSALNLWL